MLYFRRPLSYQLGEGGLQALTTSFASNSCGATNAEVHGNTSVPIALSNGNLNSSGVSFWSCECECISHSNCDRFVFRPDVGQNVTGYCQLRRSVDQLSLWETVRSFNDPLEDVVQDQDACVYVHEDIHVRADEIPEAAVDAGVENLGASLQTQLKSYMSMNETVQATYWGSVGKIGGHAKRQCSKKGALLINTFSAQNVFVKEVCSKVVSRACNRTLHVS